VALDSVLAELYRDRASAERLVTDAGLDSATVAWAPKMADTWHNILEEAEHQGKTHVLLRLAVHEYPNYAPLVAAVRQVLPDAAPRDLHGRISVLETVVDRHETMLEWIGRRVNPSLQRRVSFVIAAVLFIVAWSFWMILDTRQWYLQNILAAALINLAFIVAIAAVLWLPGAET
jgi:hypothetical protein